MNSRQVLQKLFKQRQRQRANRFIEVLQYLSATIQIAFQTEFMRTNKLWPTSWNKK